MPELLMVNPRKRKRKSSKRKSAKRRKSTTVTVRTNPRKRRRKVSAYRKRRGNPAGRGIVKNQLIPAATAAGGALALDLIWGYAPIPENLKMGPLKHLVKGAGAIGLGMLAGMVTNKSTAQALSTGALTVVMHSAMRDTVTRFAPAIQLGEYLDDDGMGEYLAEYLEDDGMGYAGAGYVTGDDESYNDAMGLSIDDNEMDYEL